MRSPKKTTKKKQKLRDLKTNKIYRFDLPCCNSAPQNLGQSHACVMTRSGDRHNRHMGDLQALHKCGQHTIQ